MTAPKAIHPALYRAGQFFIALKAYLPAWAGGVQGKPSTEDEALVKSILSTPLQRQLFARMSPNDRRHAIAVARTLRQAGHNHLALIQAALLHDVGKSIGQPILHRVLIVLFEAFWPAALDRLSSTKAVNSQFTIHNSQFTIYSSAFHLSQRGGQLPPTPPASVLVEVSRWRRPFVVHAQHPAIGAAWAQEAKCDPLAVRLIASHQDELGDESTEENELLVALQWADNLN